VKANIYPVSWGVAELGDLGQVVTGKTPSTKEPKNFGGGIPFVKPGDLDAGGFISTTVDTLSTQGLSLIPQLPKNTIMVTCIGNLGKVGLTTKLSATNQQINSVIPCDGVNNYYLYHYLCSMKPWLKKESSATTVSIINKGKFSKAPIYFPPLAEQKQIADKLDTLLAQVERTKTRLDAIPKILKRFRQSVLAAAVSGKLTEDWRENNADKTTEELLKGFKLLPSPPRYKSRSTSFIKGVYAISVGKPVERVVSAWGWIPIVDVARMESGHTPSRNVSKYWDGNVSWIGIKDARNNHAKTISETLQHTNELGLANSSARLLPKNTVCISRTASVGYVVKMGVPMATSQDFVNWVPSEVINSDWLKWLFVAEKESLFKFGKGSTHTTVYFPEWLSMHIALPHISEQTEIVRRVEELFGFADRIEARVKKAQGHVNHLTQSILAKAFRGELTADWRKQNPDLISGENSAQSLLDKIKIEREKLKPVKKKRTAKKKKTG